ncbi:MAG: formimidoylglutamase [Bacteroidetes bacterium]|nr:formimidoylglutamase [Bacteroidota bacterium]
MLSHLKLYNKQDVLSQVKIRRFETKLGERIQVLSNTADTESSIKNSTAKFVLFGIPEDIGVKANGGVGGANTSWLPFLQSFLNIQSNDFLDGQEVLLIGHFDFNIVEEVILQNAHQNEEKLSAYRHAVTLIDAEVEQLMHLITQNKKLPLVIGGGHNNSYPCIKGAAKGWHKAGVIDITELNAINLDAHADYRPLEGRHSGNGFRYAEEDGYLEKYCIVGLHQNYIPQNVWIDMVNNPFVDCITYEDIFIHEKRNFMQAVAHAAGFTEDTLCGIELDIDCIENALSSATSPAGISLQHARQYLTYTASTCRPAYLHICEGATQLEDGRNNAATGKMLSYLVSDFVKAILDVLNDVE